LYTLAGVRCLYSGNLSLSLGNGTGLETLLGGTLSRVSGTSCGATLMFSVASYAITPSFAYTYTP
jgi:hypothetical protein